MKKLIAFIIALPVAVLVIAFSVANRHSVTVSLDPTTAVDAVPPPAAAFGVPLYVLLFATLLLGIIVGGLAGWASQHGYRREARVKRREADHWHREADSEHERAEKLARNEAARSEPANDVGEPRRTRRPLPALAAPKG